MGWRFIQPTKPVIFQTPSINGKSALDFYESQKLFPLSEVVVVKKLGSPWYKVKYRE